jgi:uncharacterized protein
MAPTKKASTTEMTDTLWKTLLDECCQRAEDGPLNQEHTAHGYDHWERVRTAGMMLAYMEGGSPKISQAFAWLHDCCRENEVHDPRHGRRAALFAQTLRTRGILRVTDDEWETLKEALTDHNGGRTHPDIDVACCWDADRLDLGRVHITPEMRFMSTATGISIVEQMNRLDPR